MPQLAPYIPPRDVDLQTWANNFAALLTASPGTYGLTAGDAAIVQPLADAYSAAYILAVDPSTRTPDSVQAKNDARTDMLAQIRPYAIQISLNAGVLSSDKVAIGVNPRTSAPTPIAIPTTNPDLSVVTALPLQHVLRYRDSLASPTVKAKPYGAMQVQLYGKASATVITDPELLTLLSVNTKSPLVATWQSADVGKQAYYAARWVTRTGLVGPWSSIVNFTVAN